MLLNIDYSNGVSKKRFNHLFLLKYNKKKDKESSKLRSVILDCSNNVIAYSPPKSIEINDFINKHSYENVVVEKYVEGTMINMFWDVILNKWEIATRSVIGGKNRFYKNQKYFLGMFDDIIKNRNIDLGKLPKEYSYSFVIQHPDNMIVSSIKEYNLYLIDVYKIDNNEGNVTISDNMHKNDISLKKIIDESGIKTLANINNNFKTYDELIDIYKNGVDFSIMGIVVKKNGEWSKIRNKNYEKVKSLRGNYCDSMDRYLNLRQTNEISEYLHYFNEEINDYKRYDELYESAAEHLYMSYVLYFVQKINVSRNYHMNNLHNIYLNTRDRINIDTVYNYFDNLDPLKQLNYIKFKIVD